MPQLTYSVLQEQLAQKFPNIALQKQTGQLYASFTIEGQEYPFFARILEGNTLLQLIVFIPVQWISHYTPEVAQLLHLLNKEVELPGFGMDDNMRLPFFRYIFIAKEGVFDAELLSAIVEAMETACTTFTPVIKQVAEGQLSYREVVKLARDQGLLQPAAAWPTPEGGPAPAAQQPNP